MPDNSLSDRIFGAVPPRREREVVERVVEVPVATPLLYDVEMDGYWIGNFGITAHGIYVREDASEREWYDACDAANKLIGGRDWGKADLCLFGLEILGKTPAEIAPLIQGLSASSVETYASVSRAADKLIRVTSPSMGHFRIVMALSREHQLDWLEQATEGRWAVALLKQKVAVAAGVVVPGIDAKKALKQQQQQAKALKVKAAKLPFSERQQMILYFRDLADELERQR